MLDFHPQFGIRHSWDGTLVSSTRRPHCTPQENSLVHISVTGWMGPGAIECGQN